MAEMEMQSNKMSITEEAQAVRRYLMVVFLFRIEQGITGYVLMRS